MNTVDFREADRIQLEQGPVHEGEESGLSEGAQVALESVAVTALVGKSLAEGGARLLEENKELAKRACEVTGSVGAIVTGAFEVFEGFREIHEGASMAPGKTADTVEAGIHVGTGISQAWAGSTELAGGVSHLAGTLSHSALAASAGAGLSMVGGGPLAFLVTMAVDGVLGYQLYRAREVLKQVEDPQERTALDVLTRLLEPTDEEKRGEEEGPAVADLRLRSQNSLSAVVGSEIANEVIEIVYGREPLSREARAEEAQRILERVEKACYTRIIVKAIKMGVVTTAGTATATGVLLAPLTHGISFALPAAAAVGSIGFTVADWKLHLSERFAERQWEQRMARKAEGRANGPHDEQQEEEVAREIGPLPGSVVDQFPGTQDSSSSVPLTVIDVRDFSVLQGTTQMPSEWTDQEEDSLPGSLRFADQQWELPTDRVAESRTNETNDQNHEEEIPYRQPLFPYEAHF